METHNNAGGGVMYELVHNEEVLEKHSTKLACWIAAKERGLVYSSKVGEWLDLDTNIREANHDK